MPISEVVKPGDLGHAKHHTDLARASNEFESLVKGDGRLAEDILNGRFEAAFNELVNRIQQSVDKLHWVATDHGVQSSSDSMLPQQSNINSALSALSALGGGRLIIPRGVEVLTTGAITGANNVELYLAPGSKIRNTNENSSLVFNLIGISRFSVLGPGSLDFGPKALPTPAEGEPMTTPVKSLRMTNCEDILIQGVRFLSLHGRAIDMQGTSAGDNGIVGCRRISIIDNVFDEAADTCIDSRTGATVAPTQDLLIRGNRFKGLRKVATKVGDTEPAWSVIYLSRVQRFDVIDNDVESSADTAVMIGNGCVNFKVEGNRLKTTQVGIFLGGVRLARIIGNDIESANDMGIHHYYTGTDFADGVITIADNVIHDCAKPAVLIEGGNNVVVSGNQIDSCAFRANDFADVYKAAISVQTSSGNAPDSILVVGNMINKGTVSAATYYGVSITNTPTNIVVAGNNVIGSGYTRRFRYGNLVAGANWELQQDTQTVDTNKKLVPAAYAVINSPTSTLGALAVHPTHGLIVGLGPGNGWAKVTAGAAVLSG